MSTLLRHHSTSAVEQLQERGDDLPAQVPQPQPLVVPPPQPAHPSEQRWIHRLKELERRLKAEREARLLDRRGARQRLEERQMEEEFDPNRLERDEVRLYTTIETMIQKDDDGPHVGLRCERRNGSTSPSPKHRKLVPCTITCQS